MLGIIGTWHAVIPLGNPGPAWVLSKHNHISLAPSRATGASTSRHSGGHRGTSRSPDTARWPFDGLEKRSKNRLWLVFPIILIPGISGLWVTPGSAAGIVPASFGVSWILVPFLGCAGQGMSPCWVSPLWQHSLLSRGHGALAGICVPSAWAGCARAKAGLSRSLRKLLLRGGRDLSCPGTSRGTLGAELAAASRSGGLP